MEVSLICQSRRLQCEMETRLPFEFQKRGGRWFYRLSPGA
jgi:hypothetical protein